MAELEITNEPAARGRPEDVQITVVIPTVGRSTLSQAIESAVQQTLPPTEILVVYDLDEVPDSAPVASEKVQVLCTGGRRGPNAARQIGIEAAEGDAIALLDDDDYWYPEKLRRQAHLYLQTMANGCRPVISCGVDVVEPGGQVLYRVPRREIGRQQSISNYLFKRRELRSGEATMGPSSLLFDRRLALKVPFEAELWLHEDWDWLLRASREVGVAFGMVSGSHLAYRVQRRGKSASRSSDWRQSAMWAENNRDALTPREYGDFLLGITVSVAVDAGARREALGVAFDALRHGRPGLAAMMVAGGLLLLPRGSTSLLRRAASSGRELREVNRRAA